jgi:hypothetical protein
MACRVFDARDDEIELPRLLEIGFGEASSKPGRPIGGQSFDERLPG